MRGRFSGMKSSLAVINTLKMDCTYVFKKKAPRICITRSCFFFSFFFKFKLINPKRHNLPCYCGKNCLKMSVTLETPSTKKMFHKQQKRSPYHQYWYYNEMVLNSVHVYAVLKINNLTCLIFISFTINSDQNKTTNELVISVIRPCEKILSVCACPRLSTLDRVPLSRYSFLFSFFPRWFLNNDPR